MDIQEAELAPLWEKYKRLARKIAIRFTTPHYELDDLLQECFIIFMTAVKEYGPDSGCTLVTYLGNRFRWGLARLIYDRYGERRIKDVTALDTPLDDGDDGSDTMADRIPDPTAEFDEEKVKRAALDEVWALARCELADFDMANRSSRPGRLYDIIEAQYKYDLSLKELAGRMGVSFQLVQQERRRAINQLRKSKRLGALYDDVIGRSLTRSGLSYFQHSGTSSIEWAVLEMERLREEHEEWRREMLEKHGINVDEIAKKC